MSSWLLAASFVCTRLVPPAVFAGSNLFLLLESLLRKCASVLVYANVVVPTAPALASAFVCPLDIGRQSGVCLQTLRRDICP